MHQRNAIADAQHRASLDDLPAAPPVHEPEARDDIVDAPELLADVRDRVHVRARRNTHWLAVGQSTSSHRPFGDQAMSPKLPGPADTETRRARTVSVDQLGLAPARVPDRDRDLVPAGAERRVPERPAQRRDHPSDRAGGGRRTTARRRRPSLDHASDRGAPGGVAAQSSPPLAVMSACTRASVST